MNEEFRSQGPPIDDEGTRLLEMANKIIVKQLAYLNEAGRLDFRKLTTEAERVEYSKKVCAAVATLVSIMPAVQKSMGITRTDVEPAGRSKAVRGAIVRLFGFEPEDPESAR